MKFGYLATIITIIGLLLYGSNIKHGLLSEEKLEKYIGTVKNIRKLTNTPENNPAEQDEIAVFKSLQRLHSMPAMPDDENSSSDMYEVLGINSRELEFRAPIMKEIFGMFEKNEERKSINEIYIDIYLKYLNFSKLHMHYSSIYLIIGISIFVLSLVLNISGIYPLASLIGRFGFFIGRFSILTASLAAIVFWFLIKRNFWLDAGINVFLGPVEILFGACIALKAFDPNFPIWNRFFCSLVLPFFSSVFLIIML